MDKNAYRNEQVILAELDKLMDRFVNRVFELSQLQLVEGGKIDSGTLFKTANINREFLHKTITYPAEHAEWVEFGREPGSMPPVAPLQKWAKRKLGLDDKEAERAGWAIAQAIKERGIAPFPFLETAIDQARAEFGFS